MNTSVTLFKVLDSIVIPNNWNSSKLNELIRLKEYEGFSVWIFANNLIKVAYVGLNFPVFKGIFASNSYANESRSIDSAKSA